MTKRKSVIYGGLGGQATIKSMGKKWFQVLADYRWGKISKSEFKRLKIQYQNKHGKTIR